MSDDRPLLFDPVHDSVALADLRASGRVWRQTDAFAGQLEEWLETRTVGGGDRKALQSELLGDRDVHTAGVWVYYPWSGVLVRILPRTAFQELRLDRNRDKITRDEQQRLCTYCIGIVGLSVGNAVALTMAQEGVGGTLRLADFDTLSTSNLNRVRAPIHEVGLLKTQVAARQIAEVDPFVRVECFPKGLDEDNLPAFLDGLDLIVDECDGLAMKVSLRRAARRLRLPLVMETSDRGMLDVERYDLDPGLAFMHGLLPDLPPETLKSLSREERLGIVADTVGTDVSTRAAASLLEIDSTVSTWPQLASDVALGGATVCATVRKLLLGQPMPTGRRFIDLSKRLLDIVPVTKPVAVAPPIRPAPQVPELHQHLVAEAVVAPSPGNCQPWRVVSYPDHLEVHHDLLRARTLLDPEGYAGAVAVGALLEGLHLSASTRGLRLEIEETGAFDGCMARVTLHPGGALDPMARFLGSRFTDRRRPHRCEVPVEVLAGMRSEVLAPARLDWLQDLDAIDGLGPHLGAVDRVRFLHPQLQVEMWNEVRWTEEDALARPDGISVGEMDVGVGDLPILKLLARAEVAADLRERGLGGRLGNLVKEWLASASAVGLLSAPGTSPRTLLAAGRSMHRMWLAAHAYGFTLQPVGVVAYMIRHLGSPFDTTYTESELATLRGADAALSARFPEVPAADRLLLFRILHGSPRYSPTVRRPLADVLIPG